MASLQEYLTQYTKENRMEFMKLCLSKYLFHNYKISDFNIKDEHLIVQNSKLRSEIQEIIAQGGEVPTELETLATKLSEIKAKSLPSLQASE